MMDERTPHIHRCEHCGDEWACSKVACNLDDECRACEVEHFETWAEANALTTYQPTLEPIEALLGAKGNDDEPQ